MSLFLPGTVFRKPTTLCLLPVSGLPFPFETADGRFSVPQAAIPHAPGGLFVLRFHAAPPAKLKPPPPRTHLRSLQYKTLRSLLRAAFFFLSHFKGHVSLVSFSSHGRRSSRTSEKLNLLFTEVRGWGDGSFFLASKACVTPPSLLGVRDGRPLSPPAPPA